MKATRSMSSLPPASSRTDRSPPSSRRPRRLAKAPDPKLDAVAKLLKPLIAEGANPVVFCRFIATAEHVANALRKAFPKLRIEAVTGELPSEERRARVDAMGEAEQRLLVATDCLSEGINLQSLFDTVIHYDLSWNPTRHQQREGRVDRFGQPAKLVRSVLLYSPDSSIDGAVLEVILRKAEQIRKATGVTVPLPDERGAVTGALMNAVLLRKGRSRQLSLDFGLRRRYQGHGDNLARCRGRRAPLARAVRPEHDQARGSHPGVAALARSARQSGSGPPFRRTGDEPPRCGARAQQERSHARPYLGVAGGRGRAAGGARP